MKTSIIETSANESPYLPGKLAAVLLDWAGTTVDFGSCAPVAALRAAFQQAGIEISEQEARQSMGKSKRDHVQDLVSLSAFREKWSAKYRRNVQDKDIDEIYENFVRLQGQCVVEHSAVISGCPEAVQTCRELDLRIGSTTGYSRALIDSVAARAKTEGYEPDVIVCADDVLPGRPAPWLCFEAARLLGVYPMSAIVVVDDTPAGVAAGRNAGSWTVGIVASGNEVGLTFQAFASLSDKERDAKVNLARSRLERAGAHFLIDTVAELPLVVARINQLLAQRRLS